LEKKTVSKGTLFILEKPFHERSKWLFAFYCIAFFAPATWYLSILFSKSLDITSVFLSILIVSGFIIAGYRYAQSASRTESILVTPNNIEVTEQSWFYKKRRKYDISRIKEFRFVERPVLTPHPLAGNTFDYLGFQTQQQVINEMFGDNRIAFEYEGKTVCFGKNLYSWDYEDLLITIFPITNYN